MVAIFLTLAANLDSSLDGLGTSFNVDLDLLETLQLQRLVGFTHSEDRSHFGQIHHERNQLQVQEIGKVDSVLRQSFTKSGIEFDLLDRDVNESVRTEVANCAIETGPQTHHILGVVLTH